MTILAPHRDSVTNMPPPPTDWVVDALMIGSGTAAVLLAEHVVFWDTPHRLPRPAAYALGNVTLGLGLLAWALRHRHQSALATWVAAGTIAACGGAVVTAAYYWRHHDAQRYASAQHGGWIGGRLAVHREMRDGNHREPPAGNRRSGNARRDYGSPN